MPQSPQLRFAARCPRCLGVYSTRPTGELRRHLPCGSNTRPAPTVIGQELTGKGPFPEDVTEVADRNGRRLHRTPNGWAHTNGVVRGLWAQADFGPYMVLAIGPTT